MFKKVLIAEDHEMTNFSVQRTLTELGIANDTRNYVYYCDHALMRIQKGLQENAPYELLITDLSFIDDGTQQKISKGSELIKVAKQLQPDLKILVFSMEHRAEIANSLIKELNIDAFVPKGRKDAQDLKMAIETIYQDKKYLSSHLKRSGEERKDYHFTDFDKIILQLLSKGILQKDIPFHLQQKNIKPSGLSSVEKRLNLIKEILEFSNNEQLIAYCKDIKVI